MDTRGSIEPERDNVCAVASSENIGRVIKSWTSLADDGYLA